MAFIKKLWKDRISQFPNRRTINDGSVTKQVTVGRDEGTITEPGDSFDASNMNDLEQRIEDAYGDVVSLVASEVAVQYHGDVIFDNVPTASHGVGYAVTSDGLKTALDSKADTSAIPDELNDLSDVDISGQAQGEALVWDGTKWVNGTVSTVGNLDDLNDVDTTGKQEGDSLRYIGGEWKAKPTTVKMTQAEYNAIVDFTPYENTHIVITDAPNLNATASDIEYSSGVSVKQAIDGKQDAFTSGSLTSGTNVTILNGFYNKTGNMIFWSCCFSVSGNINTGAVIFSGLPHGNEQDNLPCFMREITASDTSLSCRIYRGGVYPNVQLTSGKTYHAFGIYTIE